MVSATEFAATPRPIADWFAVPAWRQAPPLGNAVPDGRVAVFAADPRGEELASALRDRGVSVVTVRPGSELRADPDGWQIRPGEREDYDTLLAALASDGGVPDRFVHAWALAGDPAGYDVAAAWAAQERGFFSLLRLGQAIAAAGTAPHRLDVLVAGTQDVRGDDLLSPEHATTAGITRVLPLEIGGLKAGRIDLDPAGTPVGLLLTELAGEPAAETVALRGGRRWLADFAEISLPEARCSAGLRDRGRYLITGGLGGIGLTLATELAHGLSARLVLLSRTGLPPRAEWDSLPSDVSARTSGAIAAIRAMEHAGAQVHLMTADVSDSAAMDRVRAEVAELLGGLDGVIHAAGVPGAGLVEVKEEAAARAVLEPKLAGALVLLRSLGAMTGDFIALCSSVTSLVGGVGQVDYCAANAFLDALARSKHDQRPRVISLNWSGWGDVGMLAEAISARAERPEQRRELDHPLLHSLVDDGELRRGDGKISAGTHWVLDEHRIGGVPVLPGTAYLELARAVAGLDIAGEAAVELRDVVFIKPFTVPEAADFSVTLVGAAFTVTSGGQIFCHGIAGIAAADSGQTVDIAAIRARCQQAPEASWRTGRTSAVTFGARWDCLRQVWTGDNEELALIVAPAQVAAELDRWVLHPALLDVATAFGVTRRDGAYLPLSYGRVVVRDPLPDRFYSHLRYEVAGGGVLSATVTICDEQGRELVAISDFTLRQVKFGPAGTVNLSERATPAASVSPRSAVAVQPTRLGGQAQAGIPAEFLISPADGAAAFRMILAADPGPQVAVAPIGLPQIAALIARTVADVSEDKTRAESAGDVDSAQSAASKISSPGSGPMC